MMVKYCICLIFAISSAIQRLLECCVDAICLHMGSNRLVIGLSHQTALIMLQLLRKHIRLLNKAVLTIIILQGA
jgi:hypothetical protein